MIIKVPSLTQNSSPLSVIQENRCTTARSSRRLLRLITNNGSGSLRHFTLSHGVTFADAEGALLPDSTSRCGPLRLLECLAAGTHVAEPWQIVLTVGAQVVLVGTQMIRNRRSAANLD